jgi:hypothetical protein
MNTEGGAVIIFVSHRFITDDPEKQAYLDKELARKNKDLSTKPYEDGMDDPMHALRRRIIAEEIDRIREATQNPNRDMGESKAGPLNAQSTQNIAAVAAGGGATSGAQLATFASKLVK